MAERSTGLPTAARAWVRECADGIIAVSPGPGGDVGRTLLHGRGRRGGASRRDLGVRLSGPVLPRHPGAQAAPTMRRVSNRPSIWPSRWGLPVVAGNDVRFIERDDFEAHEARVCIREGRILADPRRPRPYSEEQYLKSPREMAALFRRSPRSARQTRSRSPAGAASRSPSAAASSRSSRCRRGRGLDEWLAGRSREGLERRLSAPRHGARPVEGDDEKAAYTQRLEMELGVIGRMGYPGYFLIVADFIEWAKKHRIPVGRGAAPGAGSLVAYALGITDLDPLRYGLLFERFLNPERVSLAGFRRRFLHGGRDRVIDYVVSRYSADHRRPDHHLRHHGRQGGGP